MEFAAKLKKLMNDQRYSQDDLAGRLGVSQNLVSRWARGASVPDLRQARSLADLFGVGVDYLADDRRDEPWPAATDWDAKILEIIRAIGPEQAWLRLVGSVQAGPEPRLLPPPSPRADNKGQAG